MLGWRGSRLGLCPDKRGYHPSGDGLWGLMLGSWRFRIRGRPFRGGVARRMGREGRRGFGSAWKTWMRGLCDFGFLLVYSLHVALAGHIIIV